MASVRLDTTTEATLKRLSTRRGQTPSEVVREAIVRLAEDESAQLSAYDRLEPFVGIVDTGGRQLSRDTGNRVKELLSERERARRSG